VIRERDAVDNGFGAESFGRLRAFARSSADRIAADV
jgi:hypothetical protein